MKEFYLETAEDTVSINIVHSREFHEFSESLKALNDFHDPYSMVMFTEASVVGGPVKHNVIKDAAKIAKNTYKTTKDVYNAQKNITDGGAALASGIWDAGAAGINLITRVAGFILKYLGKIPSIVSKVLNTAADIPSDVVNKIRGNIKLYITVADLDLLYRERLMTKLDAFLSIANRLAKGDAWNYVKGTAVVKRIKKIFTTTDDQLCKALNSYYKEIGQVRFEPTLIDMSNPGNVTTYLAVDKKIEFYDDKGKKFSGNYFEAISKLADDLLNRQQSIKTTYGAITDKYNRSQAALNFSEMSKAEQTQVLNAINAISGMTSVIGNIIKYIMADMDTIYKNVSGIRGKQRNKGESKTVDKKAVKTQRANTKSQEKQNR